MNDRQGVSGERQLRDELARGLREMRLDISERQQELLVAYLRVFEKWNRAFNLSAIRDPVQMVGRHLLDSLSVAPHIGATHIIDVGTGGGLPGIPLAIVFPQKDFTLLDSNGKKTRFLTQVKHELALENVAVVKARLPEFQPARRFDGVISRAFASLSDMLQLCRYLLATDGVFYAMKGVYPEDELSELPKHYKVSGLHSLDIPGVPGERHLLVIAADGR